MNEISRKPAHTVTELASARQHQENPKTRPTIMERAVEGSKAGRGECGFPAEAGGPTPPGRQGPLPPRVNGKEQKPSAAALQRMAG